MGLYIDIAQSLIDKTPKIAVGCWKNDDFTAVTHLFAHVLFIGTSLRHCPYDIHVISSSSKSG